MGKRACAVILVLAMILCQMPSVTAKAVSPGGEAQYLEVEETRSAGTEEAQSPGTTEVQSPGEGEAEAADEGNALEAEDPAAGITVADEQSEETSEGAQDEGAGEGAPAGETSESAQVEEAGESAQAGETGDASQTAETAEDTQAGETVDDVQIAETAEDEQTGDSEYSAKIEETVEAEQAENAAETAKAGDSDYAGEEDELDDDTIAAPRNLRWEDRTGKWDAVKGAEKYKVELFRIGEDGKAGSMGTATPAGCAYTFDRIDLSVEGTYCFTVKAVIGEKESAAARSKEAKLGPVPAPGNPRWDGKIARWDAVEGHKSYNIRLYQSKDESGSDSTLVERRWIGGSVCEADFTEQVDAAGDGWLYFVVWTSKDEEDPDYVSSYNRTSKSPVAAFGNPDRIMLPTPDYYKMKFKIPNSRHIVLTWPAPDGIGSDVGYKYRLTIYKDNKLFRTVDVDKYTLSYDFTASGDCPLDSTSKFHFGVRCIPTEEETRYCAGLEGKMFSTDAVAPATDLIPSLEGSGIDPVRAGTTYFLFRPTWKGAYGDIKYILLSFNIKKTDGTTRNLWKAYTTSGNLTGGGQYMGFSCSSSDFQAGDAVSWKAVLTDTNNTSGTEYASVSGSFVVEAPGPHTVIFDGNGLGKNSSLVVNDNDFPSNMEGYEEALPVAKGYVAGAFSTVKKGLGEYTLNDIFHGTITEDMTLYTVWAPAIETVELDVAVPVCGTKVEMSGDNKSQINGPEVTIPMDKGYWRNSQSYSWLTKEADGSTPVFTGTIKGGSMYYSNIWLTDSSLNGMFSRDLKVGGSITTGKVKAVYNMGIPFVSNYASIEIGMMAEHDWSGWTTVKEAAETEDGLRRRVCKGCGEKEEEVIPATGSAAITVTTDGNGTASASADHAKAGDTVTLTATPAEGYRLYKWEVLGGGVKVSGNTFTMGKEDVEVRALFGKIPGKSEKVTVYNVAQGIKVTWVKVPDATSYYIYRDNLDGKGYKFLFRTSALEVTDKEVRYELGKKFRYKVLATSKYGGDAEGFRTSTYYRLMPTGITSVKNTGAGKMTVTYDKSSGGSGYVVRYGLKKDMSDAKVITVKGENTTTRTFSGLRKGQTYYVQARTYKIEDGIRYYSGYCLTKTVKIVK